MRWEKIKERDGASKAPAAAGVYVVCIQRSGNLEPMYVGESKNLQKRLNDHRKGFENGRRTHPHLELLSSSSESWLSAILDIRAGSKDKEKEVLYVPSVAADAKANLKFWEQLEIFALILESNEIQDRHQIEATLQREFVKTLLRETPHFDAYKEKEYKIPLLQANRSHFLGKRQGSTKYAISSLLVAMESPELTPLKNLLEQVQQEMKAA